MRGDAKYLESIVKELDKMIECRPNRLCLLAALTDGPPEDREQLIQELLLGQISMYYPDLAFSILENILFDFEESRDELIELLQNDSNELETLIHVQGAIIKHQLGKEPLTVDVLDRASIRNRNKIVGACIFTHVKFLYPDMAARIIDEITIRLNNYDLVSMLNDNQFLESMIIEVYKEINRESLTKSDLDGLTPEEQKYLIGTNLYPHVYCLHPDISGKITGMLLELDIDELLHILRDSKLRKSIIDEAVATLKAHKEKTASESRNKAADNARKSKDQPVEPRKTTMS